MKKQCVILGGGSKLGADLTREFLDQGYRVRLITSNPSQWQKTDLLDVVPVDWKTMNITDIGKIMSDLEPIDVLFFNQNSSALCQGSFSARSLQNLRHWQQSYFVVCQLPFFLIHALKNKIHKDSKIGWMLSILIRHPIDREIGHADYIGNKFTNACIMKSFSLQNHGNFFGMHPDGIIDDQDSVDKARNIVKFIDQTPSATLNGQIFSHSGQILDWS